MIDLQMMSLLLTEILVFDFYMRLISCSGFTPITKLRLSVPIQIFPASIEVERNNQEVNQANVSLKLRIVNVLSQIRK